MKKVLMSVFLCCALLCAFAFSACGFFASKSTQSTDRITFDTVYAYAQEQGYTGSYEDLIAAVKGEKGDKGETGNGIAKVEKSFTNGLVDTYTITFTNGTTFDFTVTNGRDGESGTSSPADSNAPTPDQYFLFTLLEDDTYEIAARYADMPVRTVIPAVHNAKPISKIASAGFQKRDSMDELVVPDSVTSIGSRAFKECRGLISVTIGNGVTSIGSDAFAGCIGLTSVTISDSVKSIGSEAFNYCLSLSSVTIPNSVTSIGQSAFRDCTKLEAIFYQGTKEEWEVIAKEGNNIENYTIHCKNGDIAKG